MKVSFYIHTPSRVHHVSWGICSDDQGPGLDPLFGQNDCAMQKSVLQETPFSRRIERKNLQKNWNKNDIPQRDAQGPDPRGLHRGNDANLAQDEFAAACDAGRAAWYVC